MRKMLQAILANDIVLRSQVVMVKRRDEHHRQDNRQQPGGEYASFQGHNGHKVTKKRNKIINFDYSESSVMKLAEALNQRADLQRRIAQLRERLSNNVKVQEGDQPAEKPEDLFKELEAALKQLKDLIVSINRTNQETVWEGKTLTEIIAEKDVLTMHLAALRATLDAANVRSDRYSRNEIKFVRTIDVNALQKKVDYLSRDLRVLDSKLQQANWTTDLQ